MPAYMIRNLDEKMWKKFRTRVESEGRFTRWVVEQLFTRYADGRLTVDGTDPGPDPTEDGKSYMIKDLDAKMWLRFKKQVEKDGRRLKWVVIQLFSAYADGRVDVTPDARK